MELDTTHVRNDGELFVLIRQGLSKVSPLTGRRGTFMRHLNFVTKKLGKLRKLSITIPSGVEYIRVGALFYYWITPS
jgi:hypothetical protein